MQRRVAIHRARAERPLASMTGGPGRPMTTERASPPQAPPAALVHPPATWELSDLRR